MYHKKGLKMRKTIFDVIKRIFTKKKSAEEIIFETHHQRNSKETIKSRSKKIGLLKR